MQNLVHNEMLKMLRKKRIGVIILILLVLIPIFTYAQYETTQNQIKQMGTDDWRLILQQQIINQQNRLATSSLPEEWKTWIQLHIQQNQYYLDHGINPTEPGAPTFAREFIEESVSLLLPLLVVVFVSDLVSSEYTQGTIKLLLTRPVKRWKILASKYITMILCVSLLLILSFILSYLISGVIFGYGGWNAPVLTGFSFEGEQLQTEHIHMIPQWQSIWMTYGLAWLTCVVVGTLSFMVSVLVKNTASSMGIMLAAVITGSLLMQLAPTWDAIKGYAFTHLRLTDYLSGNPMIVEGMSLSLSLTVLGIWSLLSLIVAFVTFNKRDVWNG